MYKNACNLRLRISLKQAVLDSKIFPGSAWFGPTPFYAHLSVPTLTWLFFNNAVFYVVSIFGP